MSFSWILFITVSIYLTFATAANAVGLFVTEGSSHKSGQLRSLICMSVDDDAAFIWNFDLNKNETSDHSSVFVPVKPISNEFSDCAIWQSKSCSVSWMDKTDWRIVSSFGKPMGPVVDYRWEGFNEYILNNVTDDKNLHNVPQVDWLDGTVIFSIRGTQDVQIRMCEENSPSSLCFVIKIAVRGTNSVIETCRSEVSGNSHHARNRTCKEVDNVKHETPILVAHEWRTFRLQWIRNEKKIQLFEDIEKKAFLVGQVQQWHFVRDISVRSLAQARIKFHHYDYYLATHKNALLTTATFLHGADHFCVNMLVSLCPDCQLNVSLTDSKNDKAMAYKIIFGDKHFHPNGLRTWQSIKVNLTVRKTTPIFVRLLITSVLGEDNCEDIWWAIDKIRLCEESNEVRKSTITMPISVWTEDVPEIKCQKLMHGRIVVADLSASEPFDHMKQSKQSVRRREKPCPPGCRTFRKANSDSYGCRCFRELTKKNDKICVDIVPGETDFTLVQVSNSKTCRIFGGSYDITVSQGTENSEFPRKACQTLPCVYSVPLNSNTEYTVTVTAERENIINRKVTTLEAAPGIVGDLNLESNSDQVIGKWEPPRNVNGYIRNYTVTIQKIAVLGCENLGRESPDANEIRKTVSENTVSVSGLHPYARYNFTVVANTIKPGPPRWEIFRTHQLNLPTSIISEFHLVNQSFLTWDAPENCTTITGPVNSTKLIFSGLSDWALNQSFEIELNRSQFDLETSELSPYTWYEVRAYVIRGCGEPENSSIFQKLNFTTAPAAPPAVKNLKIYEADAASDIISLQWEPPHPPNGIIESYSMSMMEGNTSFGNWHIKVSELKKCASSLTCFENLKLPSNISIKDDLQLQIRAKNMNVTALGNSTVERFKLNDLYDERPGELTNLTVIKQSHGIVILNWMHPLFSPTKIVRFRIHVQLLCSNLLINPPMENQTIDYILTNNEEVYSRELHLLSSTNYLVRMRAVNYHNITSEEVTKLIEVPKSPVTFVGKSELEAEANGTAIELKIPAIANATKNSTVVVTVKGISLCAEKSLDNLSPSRNENKSTIEWIAAEFPVNSNESPKVIFNVNQPSGVEKNCFFHLYENYHFEITVRDQDSMESQLLASASVTLNSEDVGAIFNKTWPFLAILALIPFLLLLILRFWKCRKSGKKSNDSLDLPLVSIKNASNGSLLTSKRTVPPSDEIKRRVSTRKDESDVELCDPHSHPVRIEGLEEFIKEALASRLLHSHWKMLPRGFLKRCKYGYLPKNKSKNQWDYVIPYDENRVKLKKLSSGSHSDYINASYIQGYRKPKAYIATQGPKRDKKTKIDTVLDFWRMVWQENASVICMLTNVTEDGEKKCEQYWPEVGTSVEYGDAFVLNIDHQIFVDYTIRTFQLICRGDRREIKHFHYTAWPDHGVPRTIQSLAVFMRKLIAAPLGEGPMIVHSSVGNGRTGTLILCDICLQQAVDSKTIDIPATTLRLRQDRANMVDTLQQYLLAHFLIAECKILERTQIPCNDRLKERVEELRQTLPSDVQRLKKIVWQDRALRSLANRPSIVGAGILNASWESDEGESSLPNGHICRSNCFHVVSAEGIKRKGQFLATKQPSALTLPNLGNLLAEKKIELIIVLQPPEEPKDTCNSALDETSSRPLSHIEFRARVKLRNGKYFMAEKLELVDTSQVEIAVQPVRIITCTEWTYEKNKTLPPVEALVSLWMASEKVKQKEGPVLIICRDGITGCGLYLALCCLLEQMSLDRECDVISAVRTVQRTNPSYVQSLEQVEYLYDAAINYNSQFATYVDVP